MGRPQACPEVVRHSRCSRTGRSFQHSQGVHNQRYHRPRKYQWQPLNGDIVSSVAFTTELFDVPVRDADGELQTTVYDYLQEHQRSPWWSTVISLPFKCIGWTVSLFSGDEEEADSTATVNPFQLTKKENEIVKALNNRIAVSVDKKSLTVSIAVTMQDPLISATLTDTVMQKLQDYITDYRTNKARHDLDFTQKLYDEAQQKY